MQKFMRRSKKPSKLRIELDDREDTVTIEGVTFDGNAPDDRQLLLGCWDGFVRALDPAECHVAAVWPLGVDVAIFGHHTASDSLKRLYALFRAMSARVCLPVPPHDGHRDSSPNSPSPMHVRQSSRFSGTVTSGIGWGSIVYSSAHPDRVVRLDD